MKFLKLSIAFFIVCQTMLAQQEINTSFKDEMNNIFQNLDKDKVPHGILLDFGMEFTNVKAFNESLTDSTFVNKIRLKEIYKTLLTSRVKNVSDGFVLPDDFDRNWHNARNKNEIVLSGLYFKYARLSGEAYPDKIIIKDEKLYDKYVKGVWQNPYEENKTFAITTPLLHYKNLTVKVKLPKSLFYSNVAAEVERIEIDMDDGQGYRSLPFNQQISTTYEKEGNKIWKYKIKLSDGSIMQSHSKIKISEGVNSTPLYDRKTAGRSSSNFNCNGNGRYHFELTASEAYLGQNANVKVTFDDANDDCEIRKPLIVAEGFDVGTLLNPENQFGANNIIQFINSVDFSSSIELEDLIVGYEQEYDIIYVDWENGVDYLQRNALALQEVIEWVNTNKVGGEQNIILGQSMGGVIARYALTDMENDNDDHDTKLFISHDAPQQGANVPLSFQYMYRHLTNQYITASQTLFGGSVLVPLLEDEFNASTYLSILDTPASRQLLKVWSDQDYSTDPTIHDDFFNELQNLNSNNGYPNQNGIRNIAISNGSECGTPLNFNPGDPLFELDYNKDLSFWGDLLSMIYNPLGGTIGGLFLDEDFFGVAVLGMVPGSSKYIVNFDANSLDNSFLGSHQVYKGLVRYKKKLFWVFDSQVTITSVSENQPNAVNLALDHYGGGFYSTGSAIDTNILPSGLSIDVKDNFSFIPTTSALDIGGGDVALFDPDYRNSYVGANPPSGSKSSPFANFVTAFSNPDTNNNERHLEFNKRNGDWLAKEIIGNNIDFSDCSYLCSGNIQGSTAVCSTSNFSITGQTNSVSWTIEPSNAGTINVSPTNPNNISLTRNTNFYGNAVLTAFVTTEKCGSGKITKNVELGTPTTSQNVTMNGPNNLNPGQTGTYSFNTSYFNNASSFDWVFFSNTLPNAQQYFDLNIISNGTFTVKPDFDVPGGYYTVQARIINTCGFYSLSKTIYVEEGDGTPVLYKNSNIYRIYPNPSSSYFNVSLINENQTPTSSKGIFGEILDLNGLFIRKIKIVNNKAQVNINDLKKGIYILRIHYDGKTEGHQVIVE